MEQYGMCGDVSRLNLSFALRTFLLVSLQIVGLFLLAVETLCTDTNCMCVFPLMR